MPVLQFKGKTAVDQHHRLVPHHVIEPDAKLSLTKKPSLDGNLIIEGDNLLALKALMPTHAGRVKCIYIDPPYNTGKEEWVYNDNLTQPQFKDWVHQVVGREGEDACRHDKWCCMMLPRLRLLHELLADAGVIFVSIDDNELQNLVLLMEEVFGPENRVATLVWKGATDNNPTLVAVEHEYVVCWAKNRAALPTEWTDVNPAAKEFMLAEYGALRERLKTDELVQEAFREFIKANAERCQPLTHYDRIDADGPYTGSRKVHNPGRDGYHYDIPHPVTGKTCKEPARGYRYPEARMKDLLKSKRVLFGKDENQIIQLKEYLRDYEGTLKSVIDIDSRVGANTLEAIFGSREVFKGPKPVELIKTFIRFCTSEGDVILDSFAGSGTTGHAVLEANAEDGEPRTFVLIQMPHDSKKDQEAQRNICETITAERLRRVIKGYSRTRKSRGGKATREAVAGLSGEFTYARLGDVLLDDSRTFGKHQPKFMDLARYIWFTDTSRPLAESEIDTESGRLGVYQGTAYYLLYSPDKKGRTSLDRAFLDALKRDKAARKIVYCEKVWVHRDELAAQGVVAMVVPFNLK